MMHTLRKNNDQTWSVGYRLTEDQWNILFDGLMLKDALRLVNVLNGGNARADLIEYLDDWIE
jgi:hypothetical protein